MIIIVAYDKFYTKPEVARQCYDFLKKEYPQIDEEFFLEPSAGNGVFLQFLKQYIAYDIMPEGENIIKQDFLSVSFLGQKNVAIGNPPFGKRSKLAIDFFNHCAKGCKIIAFVLPVSFMKWGVQKQLNKNFKLKNYFYLPQNSFLANGEEYNVRCVFQVWGIDGEKDLRLIKSPPVSSPDFNLWQYNATPQAEKYIDENWKYAVYRQGYKDYTKLFTKQDREQILKEMRNGIQFFFMEPLNQKAENFILQCDFSSLAARNTTTPGFGKADFVSFYEENDMFQGG